MSLPFMLPEEREAWRRLALSADGQMIAASLRRQAFAQLSDTAEPCALQAANVRRNLALNLWNLIVGASEDAGSGDGSSGNRVADAVGSDRDAADLRRSRQPTGPAVRQSRRRV